MMCKDQIYLQLQNIIKASLSGSSEAVHAENDSSVKILRAIVQLGLAFAA